jgi:hypothetical protein
MGRIVLTFTGIIWLGYGLMALVAPTAVVDAAGIALGTADAMTDVRAVYGGAQIGLGLLLLYCSRVPAMLRPGLIALGLIASGILLARVTGIVVDGARGGFTFFALSTEVVAVSLAWISLNRASGPQQSIREQSP